jgi:hypothetical protein
MTNNRISHVEVGVFIQMPGNYQDKKRFIPTTGYSSSIRWYPIVSDQRCFPYPELNPLPAGDQTPLRKEVLPMA